MVSYVDAMVAVTVMCVLFVGVACASAERV